MTSSSLHIRSACIFTAPPQRWIGLAAVLSLQLLSTACSPAPENKSAQETKMAPAESKVSTPAASGPVVAKVNGVEMRQGDLVAAELEIGQQLAQMQGDARRDYLITYVADIMLLTEAAEAKKLNESDEFKQQLELARKKLLMDKLLENEAKAATTDAAMRKVYDDATKQMGAEPEVRARHILVETEDEAKAIKDELDKGGDFAEISKQKSKDTGAAAEGGDLGYFSKEQMVPEFAEAAFNLEKDKISDPVKSPFGWHIIKVEDKRTRPLPDFEQVKGQIETFVKRKAQAEYVTKLREAAKIERLDSKPETPPAASKPAEPEKK
jgi:peptidyl-prolyl cis-trans isomerase C